MESQGPLLLRFIRLPENETLYTAGGNVGPQFVAALKAMQSTLRSSITHLPSPTSPWSVKHELGNLDAAN